MFACVEDLMSVLFFSKSDDLSSKLTNVADHSIAIDNHCHEWADFVHQVDHEGFYTFVIHGKTFPKLEKRKRGEIAPPPHLTYSSLNVVISILFRIRFI